MKLGIGSYTFPWAIGVPGYPPPRPLAALDLLRKATCLGAAVVQICDNLPLHLLSEEELAELRRTATAARIEIEVGTRGAWPEHLRRYLHLAERLQSPILRLVTDEGEYHPSHAELLESIAAVLPDCERVGVKLAIENHGRQTSAELIALLQCLDNPYVGICLDTTNSFGCPEMPRDVVEYLAPWAVNLHLKDFTIRRLSHMFGYVIEGCPLGQGRLDVPWVLERVDAEGREMSAIIELWTPPEETVAATIAKQNVWAEESVAYLRPLLER